MCKSLLWFHLFSLLGLLGHLLLNDLLFLDKESSNNSGSNAGVASGATVGAGHGAVSLGSGVERVVALGGHVLNTGKGDLAIAADSALAGLLHKLSNMLSS